MTLSQIQLDLYRRLGYASTPATEVSTRLTAFANQTHRQILTRAGFSRLRDDTLTIASVATQALYTLPPAVGKILHISDRTNNRPLEERSLTWLRSVDPGLTSIGGPSDVYVPVGLQAVAVQPTAAAEIFIKSTAAGDTGTAYLEGIRTGGYPVTLSKVMTGVTAVSFSATIADLIEITKLYLSVAAVGTVTVHSVSGAGTELARIPIGSLFARYQGIQLWPTPGSAITYHVDYVRIIPELINPTDEPLLPDDFHYLLVDGALVKEFTKKDDLSRRQAAQNDFEEGIAALRHWLLANPDTVASLRRVPLRWSSLGPSYPAGS